MDHPTEAGAGLRDSRPPDAVNATPAGTHRVQFYEDDAFLVEAVARFMRDALDAGAAGVLFATAAHLDAVGARLSALGVDVAAAHTDGRYVALDAADTLDAIMDGDAPNPERFDEVIGGAITKAAAGRTVHAFGEMVALLIAAGKDTPALLLERLWDDLALRRGASLSLLCAYPLRGLATTAHHQTLALICDAHGDIVPAESYAGLSTGTERVRAITALQQKACALENEIAERTAIAARLERQLASREVLYRLVALAARAADLHELSEAAVDAIRTGVRADRASILLFDEQGVMRFTASRGLSAAYRSAVEGHAPWSRDTANPAAILVPDVDHEPALSALHEVIAAEGIRSLAFIPIGCHGRLLGKFMVYFDRRHDYSAEEVQLATMIAHNVGFGVERARAEAAIEQLLCRERAARDEAERARATAESANQAKDQFLATLSHELRTPLNAIFGWVRLLRSTTLDAATVERALEVIERNVVNQGQLISDLLDVSRVITGKMVLHLVPIELAPVIDIAIDSIRPAAEARGITIRSVLDDASGLVLGDADRLQQVLWNLLSNAVKFTPGGGTVEVRLERAGRSTRIEVVDTGKGITADLLPHLFERFRQGDTGSKREHGGLGLGLAIVRHLTELHGGTVRAESAGPGTGATFVVELPLHAPHGVVRVGGSTTTGDASAPPMPRGALRGLRVLVVDDNTDTCEMLVAILEQQGARVVAATSADEALARLDDVPPDVLLSDIAMPGADGYDLIRRARSRLRDAARPLRAIAVTAFARPEDRHRALAAGFDSHITKPVEPARLVRLIAQVARARGHASAKSA